jgi:hypothetical protein
VCVYCNLVILEVLTAVIMKIAIFWNMILCSQELTFWRIVVSMSLELEREASQHAECTLLVACSHALLTLSPWRWKEYISQKCWETCTWLHSIASQLTELFIVTAVRTSDLVGMIKFYVKYCTRTSCIVWNMAVLTQHSIQSVKLYTFYLNFILVHVSA